MSRGGWFVVGAASGIYAMARAKRAVWAVTPDGLAARAAAVSAGLRALRTQVADDMSNREHELRERMAHSAGQPSAPLIEPAPSHHRREDVVTDGHR